MVSHAASIRWSSCSARAGSVAAASGTASRNDLAGATRFRTRGDAGRYPRNGRVPAASTAWSSGDGIQRTAVPPSAPGAVGRRRGGGGATLRTRRGASATPSCRRNAVQSARSSSVAGVGWHSGQQRRGRTQCKVQAKPACGRQPCLDGTVVTHQAGQNDVEVHERHVLGRRQARKERRRVAHVQVHRPRHRAWAPVSAPLAPACARSAFSDQLRRRQTRWSRTARGGQVQERAVLGQRLGRGVRAGPTHFAQELQVVRYQGHAVLALLHAPRAVLVDERVQEQGGRRIDHPEPAAAPPAGGSGAQSGPSLRRSRSNAAGHTAGGSARRACPRAARWPGPPRPWCHQRAARPRSTPATLATTRAGAPAGTGRPRPVARRRRPSAGCARVAAQRGASRSRLGHRANPQTRRAQRTRWRAAPRRPARRACSRTRPAAPAQIRRRAAGPWRAADRPSARATPCPDIAGAWRCR